MECAASGAVKYIKTITRRDLITTLKVPKNKLTPTKISKIPKEVALVVACILLNKLLNRTIPIEAIKTKSDPSINNIGTINSFICL